MNKGRYASLVFTLLFFVLLAPFLFSAVVAPPLEEYDFADINTSNVDGVTDVGSHSDFTAQQAGPDSIYDSLTEEAAAATSITYENSLESYSATGQSAHNFNYLLQTGSGNERLVVVTVSWEDAQASASISSLTIASTPMTKIADVTAGTGYSEYVSLWYLLDSSLPSSAGSYNVAVTTSESITREIYVAVAEYSGVKQSAPDDYDTHANPSSGNTAITLTATVDGSLVIAGVGEGGESTLTATNNINNLQEQILTSSASALGHHMNVVSGNIVIGWNNLATREGMAGAVWQPSENNFGLDLEVQWTNANYSQIHEELCIFGGSMDSENIQVHVWNGSTWQIIFADLSTGWNNISVSEHLVSQTFTIRFNGGTETGDTFQDSWEIDCTLLHTWGDPPIASFLALPDNPYTEEPVTFNASESYDPDGTIENYTWNFGDGSNGTGETTSHSFTDDGIYTITLTVTDDDDLQDTTSTNITVLNRSPVASFSESATTVLTDSIITFNASSSYDSDGSIVSYFWTFGDGQNTTGMIIQHAYGDDGIYIVNLTIIDDDSASDTTTSTITVINRSPVASFTKSSETAYSLEPLIFNASLSYDPDGVIASYWWDFGDGVNASGVVVGHAYADDGVYVVTLTVVDDDEATDSTTATLTILNRSPVASFTESAEMVYTAESISFNASLSSDLDGSVISYFWDFGDGTNATGILVTHMYVDNGTYTVTLTVTDDDGAANATTATIAVSNRSPVASFMESASTVLTSEAITFNASESHDIDGTIVSFFWIFGDGTNSSGMVTSHAYADDGVYTVTLIVTDDDGATANSNATKNVLNRSPVASFTESAEMVYTAESISFNASLSSDLDGSVISYFWDFGDGTNATGVTVAHGYVDDGVYTVTLTVTDDDGASASVTAVKVVLNRLPVAGFTASASTVQTSEVIDFNASSSSDPDGVIVSYWWDFGDGVNASGVVVGHAYADDGVYVVTLTVVDDDGATDSATATKNILNRTPSASFSESASTVFTGEAIYFDASASSDPDGVIVSYFWDFGDGRNATGAAVEHAYTTDGIFTVTLTVIDDDGAPDFAQATKTVLPSLSDVRITNVIPSSTEIYKGNVLNVTVTVLNEGTGTATFNVTLYRSEVYGWHLVEIENQLVWYSDGENFADFLLLTPIAVPGENPTLTFETMYNVENLYDFGFVQISTDDGVTWVSLENSYTTSNHEPDTSPEIVTNLPGLTGTSEDWPEWKTMTFNLGEYAGQTVLLGFRYMTDIGRFEDGWYINNITINGGVISNQAFIQANPPQLHAIQTLTIDSLAPGGQRSLIFHWNTTDTFKGSYFLSAVADPIAGEIDLLDNSFPNGIVEVRSNPDLDGDGDVDIFDVVLIASLYGCTEGDADWNPKADLVEDGEINIFDIVEVAANYGKTLLI